jgi:LCP family protein required for cell wall assembly
MASYLPKPKSKQPKPEKIPEPPKPPEPEPVSEVDRPARRRGLPDWAKGMLMTLAFASVLFVGLISYSLVRNFVGTTIISINLFNPSTGDNTPLPIGVTPTVEIPPPAAKPWNGADRITILAMGLDSRDWEQQPNKEKARSDTMMVMTMDPIAKTAAILSIPRDLYVEIPGYGFDKINKAYFFGEDDIYTKGGGPGLAMKTVENLLGVPINYYAVVDFNSFTTFVDTIGGIDVYINFDNMKIDPVGPEDVKELFFGMNHLTGSEALAFARARSTEGGDFDRAARTQQVILAIRDKVLNLNMIPTLLTKAPELFNQFSSEIKTNLTLEQIIQLAMVFKDVHRDKIHQGVIDGDYLLSMEMFNEESFLIPNLEKVRELRAKMFTSGGILGYATPPADLTVLAFQENAKIEVVNGTYTSGLAKATKEFLVRSGFSEANITTRDATEEELNFNPQFTIVTDYTGRPFTVRSLYGLMKLGPINLKTNIRLDSSVDIQIFLKYDWSIPQ